MTTEIDFKELEDTFKKAWGVTPEELAEWMSLSWKEKQDRYERELVGDMPLYIQHHGALGLMLQSPLVFDIPLHLPPAHLNRQYRHKHRLVSERIAKGDYPSALPLFEKPCRLSRVLMWHESGKLTRPALRECLADAWVADEYPIQHVGKANALRLFRAAGWMSDSTGDVNDPAAPVQPTIPLRLYRGCLPKWYKGISWTADPTRAEWFAKRFNQPGRVYTLVVPPGRMMANFNTRGEAEFVVQTWGMEPEVVDG